MMSTAPGLHLPATFFRSTLALLGAVLLSAWGWAAEGGPGTGGTTFTTTATNSTVEVFSGDGMQRFSTRVQSVGTQPSGFDLSFAQAVGDPAVQSAIAAARKILTDAGVPQSVANQGPVRTGSVLTSTGPAGAVIGSQTTTTFPLITTTTIGPANIFIGDNKATPFFVAAGNVNIDVETRNTTTITRSRGASLLSETYVIPIDFGAVLSLAQSGLPVALVQREALLALEQAAGRDINGRLFRLRAGSVKLRAEGDVDEGASGRWEFFASGDFGNAAQGQRGQQTAFGSDTWAATVGAEAAVAPGLTLGFAATWLENRTLLGSSLGSLDIEGFALAAYASYVRAPFYADLLYRFGDYEDRIRRNTLYGATAQAAPQAWTHTVEFHTGANFKLGPITTGPMLGLAYTHGTLDGYTETGAGSQNTSTGTQRYDSLKTQVGWQASRRVPLQIGAVTWQLRASWERENLNAPASVGVSLVNSPLYALAADGTLQRTGGLTLSGTTTRAGDDYIALGGGLLFEITANAKVMLDYEEHLARAGRSERTGAIRVSVAF